ncbi:MAG: hypothetical protein JWN27_2873 [Candidatus Eremiobacteraeota bacterium]|nr:hypothetical protein [Candidatus Eremiobacteraeota bacterium]
MFALRRSSRVALAAAALAAFSAAYVATPIVARSQSGSLAERVPERASASPEPPAVVVAPRRDPFAGAPAGQASGSSRAAPGESAARMPSVPAAVGPLPPNAGAGGGSFPLAPAMRVTAVMTGAHPFALVDDGGTTRIVATGDELGGAVIAAIRIDGIHLGSGAIIPLATPAAGQSAPEVRVRPSAVPTPPPLPGGPGR